MNIINIEKLKELNRGQINIISELLTERLPQINKRVKQIRNLKTYKEKIISNFQMSDLRDYLIELNHLQIEYNQILNLYDDGLNILTDFEQKAIKEFKNRCSNE